jgi:hypothetical protein
MSEPDPKQERENAELVQDLDATSDDANDVHGGSKMLNKEVRNDKLQT